MSLQQLQARWVLQLMALEQRLQERDLPSLLKLPQLELEWTTQLVALELPLQDMYLPWLVKLPQALLAFVVTGLAGMRAAVVQTPAGVGLAW